MHGYVKLMMGPFSVLQGYPSIGFGSTLPPPGSYTEQKALMLINSFLVKFKD